MFHQTHSKHSTSISTNTLWTSF